MFVGEYYHNLDDKSRLCLPTKFRSALGKKAVVTRGLDNCLFLYAQKEWVVLAKKLAGLPLAQANTRAFARLMLAGAMEVEIDKQGRVLIPDYLKEFAKLGKKAVLTGMYDRLEIWDEDIWKTYRSKTEKNSTDIAEALSALGV